MRRDVVMMVCTQAQIVAAAALCSVYVRFFFDIESVEIRSICMNRLYLGRCDD